MNLKQFRQLAIFLLCWSPLTVFAQNPYKLSWKREAAWLLPSGIGSGVSLLLHQRNQPFTVEQVERLDINNVPKFERFATRHYSQKARKASDIILYSTISTRALLLSDKEIRRNAPTTIVLAAETIVLNFALTNLCKEIIRRPRPYAYNPDVPMSEKLKRDTRQSFFSGHTSFTAAGTFSTAKIWCDYNPDSRWKPVVWATAVAIPATVGYLRIKGGKHYLTDVVTGFIIGGACGILVPHFHKRKK